MNTAFVFPGQGSQYVGMGREMYLNYPEAASVFKRADAALGFSISRLCFEGPEEELQKTVNTQPAVLTTSLACLEVFKKAGGTVPSAVAGHSLGEYTALVAAGSLAFEDALRVVRKRGEYMQEAVPLGAGGMAAVMGLSAKEVISICRRASAVGTVEAVNLNCPGQIVVAGDQAGINAAGALAKKAGARRFVPLPVSAPFHSRLMKPAGERLARDLKSINIADPGFPVVTNVDADFVHTGSGVRHALIRQVYSPVRWEESIRLLNAAGINTFIEIGPGKVLSGLIKKICRTATIYHIEDEKSLEKNLALMKEVG
jgi:[acyl-carrier-protein] S-malonyltransferase